jgi:xylulokinase
MGVMLSAAGSLQWYRDTVAPRAWGFAERLSCQRRCPRTDGLIFLPSSPASARPIPDPLARGASWALRGRGQAHLHAGGAGGRGYGLRMLEALMGARAVGDPAGARLRRRGAEPALAQILGHGSTASWSRRTVARTARPTASALTGGGRLRVSVKAVRRAGYPAWRWVRGL